jgi:hypothetical protein
VVKLNLHTDAPFAEANVRIAEIADICGSAVRDLSSARQYVDRTQLADIPAAVVQILEAGVIKTCSLRQPALGGGRSDPIAVVRCASRCAKMYGPAVRRGACAGLLAHLIE